jgi:uncharacterized protein YyaL (SSP411 family)
MTIIAGEDRYREQAVTAMRSMRDPMADHPAGFEAWLCALDFYLAEAKEIVVIGQATDPRTEALLATIQARYLPHKVMLAIEPGELAGPGGIPLLEGRTLKEGKPTAYLCHNYACQAPTTEPDELKAQLEG